MEELIRRIQGAKRIALISHIHPDGDAVGSLLAMHLGLAQLGKEVHSCLVEGVPQIFTFLSGSEQIDKAPTQPSQTDLCIILDTQDAARTGVLEEMHDFSSAGKLANIDHHPKGDLEKLAQVFYRDTEVSSCAELCYQVLRTLGSKLTPDIATALLTGMYTDTGAFQYENTTNQTLEIAAELMRRGGKLQKIAATISRHKTVPALKLMGLAMERIELHLGGRCAVSVLSYDDFVRCGATAEDAEGIVGALNVLNEVAFCLLLIEPVPGKIRGSLRTTEGHTLNVSEIGALLGGGGHPRASGFMLNGHLEGDATTGWKVEPFLVS